MRPISGTTRVLAVIGYPVRHSLSPPMQNAALAELGLDLVYIPLEIAPAELPVAFAGLKAAGLLGFNATIPHKQALVPLVDQLTPEAELTGTVNTVHFERGRALGDSTDGPGFVAALAAAGCELSGREVVLLGAGGSARAVSVSLARAGAGRITVANRTPERARALAELLCERLRPGLAAAVGLTDPALGPLLARADLIVNTTSVGMHPEIEAQPVSLPDLKPGSWLTDIIYNPPETRLMQEARRRGAKVANGVDMLVYQGALSLRRWTGLEPPLARMREVLTAELRRRAAGG